MTTATETVNGNGVAIEFTEADMETIQLLPEELQELQSEMEPNLEDITYEEIGEEVEEYFEEEVEEEGLERKRRRRKSKIAKPVLKAAFRIFKRILKKIVGNPKTRAVLAKAVRRGQLAVCKLLIPVMSKALPFPVNLLAAQVTKILVRILWSQICKAVGVKTEEVESFEESIFI